MCSSTAVGSAAALSPVAIGVTGAAAEVARAAGVLVAELDGGGLAELGHDELAGVLVGLRGSIDRIESAFLRCVRQVDASGSYAADGAVSVTAWLRATARLSGPAARDAVVTARELDRRLPALARALADGAVSVDAARAVARGVDGVADGDAAAVEPIALRAARELAPDAVRHVMRRFRHALDPDAGAAAALRRWERRGLSLAATTNGMVAVSGLLDEVTGATVIAAVDAHSAPGSGDRRTPAQRRADALAELCRRALTGRGAPTTGRAHPHVVLTVDAATLRRDPGHARADLDRVGPTCPDTARRVACDADTTLVGLDARGVPVDLARRRRYFTADQRRAITVRDGPTCPWPVCDYPAAWSDGHHLRHWADGGRTSVQNGLLPCPRHHTLLHEGGWSLHPDPRGGWQARHPTGRLVAARPTALEHPPP